MSFGLKLIKLLEKKRSNKFLMDLKFPQLWLILTSKYDIFFKFNQIIFLTHFLVRFNKINLLECLFIFNNIFWEH